ncbi:MAG: AAA family ATPase [Synergistaceae bacterium]|nr:AAA family ATPase [Synergistaceae bacterium]
MILRPRYLEQLKDYMWDGQIKVITGIRRCGKSVLLFELFYNYLLDTGVQPKNIIRLELDKRRDARFRNPVRLAA